MAVSLPNPNRRQSLKIALEKADQHDLVGLDFLAGLWGVSKPRFVNVKRELEQHYDFPQFQQGPGNTHLYPAKAAIEVLLNWETRNDNHQRSKIDQSRRILGLTDDAKAESALSIHSPQELLILSRLNADLRQQERDQGLWLRVEDVSSTTAEVFFMISEVLSDLDNQLDPNGFFEPTIRIKLKDLGHGLLNKVHDGLKVLLDADGQPNSGENAPTFGRPSPKKRSRRN